MPTAPQLGVGFVPYSPLGRGFLTGTIGRDTDLAGDWRDGLQRFQGRARSANLVLVDVGARSDQDDPHWVSQTREDA